MYPVTAEDYAALASQGLTVQYAETSDAHTPPAGDGWEYWSLRQTSDAQVAVWRRIIPVDELPDECIEGFD